MDKNLKHLLDISPYKTSSEAPFNTWELMANHENKRFLVIFYSKQSEYWNSLRKINHWVLEQIYQFENDCIPYTIDLNQPDIWEQHYNILSKSSAVICFALNKNISEVIKKLREYKPEVPLNFIHTTSNRSWGYQFKYFGLDLISQNDDFYCLCERDKDLISNLFPKNKIHVFTPKSTKAIVKEKVGERNLVYTGRISFEKNIHWILAALAVYKQQYSESIPKLNIFGEEDILGRKSLIGQGTYKKLLLKLIKELDLEDCVIFHGYQNHDSLLAYLDRINDVGIFLSTYDTENFGLAPREVIDSGSSIILSAWGAFNDLIKAAKDSNKIGYVSPTLNIAGIQFNPYDLAKQIHLMLTIDKSRQKEFVIDSHLPQFKTKKVEFIPIDKKLILEYQCLTQQKKQVLFFNQYATSTNPQERDNGHNTINPFLELKDNKVQNKLNGNTLFIGKGSEGSDFKLNTLNGKVLYVSKSIYSFLTTNDLIF